MYRMKGVPSYLHKYLTKRIEILDSIELNYYAQKHGKSTAPQSNFSKGNTTTQVSTLIPTRK